MLGLARPLQRDGGQGMKKSKPKRNYAAERRRTGELSTKGENHWAKLSGERRTVVGASLVLLEEKLSRILP